MIVDWHAHYPMKLRESSQDNPPSLPPSPGDILQAIVLAIANALFNWRNFKPVVTIKNLRAGDVKVALSVLYQPFDEIDLTKAYGAPPDASYFADLRNLKNAVEKDIADHHPDAMIAHNPREFELGLNSEQTILIHAVEGGFHFGPQLEDVERQVAELADWGVAYVTVAHLFFRQVASNAPALPFMQDSDYNRLFPQQGEAITPLGEGLLRAMVKHDILIDITHMSRPAIDATLALLEQVEDERRVGRNSIPIVATHSAYNFGGVEYNIGCQHIKAIAARKGLIGLITCEHWMSAGKNKPKNFDETMALICEHVEAIKEQAETYDVIGIGSDMDGFIRPSLKGLETPRAFRGVEQRLKQHYNAIDPDLGGKLTSGNSLQFLRKHWKGNS